VISQDFPPTDWENCSIKFPKVRKSFSSQVFRRFIYLEQKRWAWQETHSRLHVPLCHLAWNFCTLPSSGRCNKAEKNFIQAGANNNKKSG